MTKPTGQPRKKVYAKRHDGDSPYDIGPALGHKNRQELIDDVHLWIWEKRERQMSFWSKVK